MSGRMPYGYGSEPPGYINLKEVAIRGLICLGLFVSFMAWTGYKQYRHTYPNQETRIKKLSGEEYKEYIKAAKLNIIKISILCDFEGLKMEIQNYLFICAYNIDRSPTAERVCEKIAKKRNLEIKASSAGLEDSDNPVTKEMADKADKIFVMEDYMKNILIENYHQAPEKIICLDVPNKVPDDPREFEKMFEEKLDEYIIKLDL